ncbi:hypothetical protein BpHYR1_038753 [Brachionus plicatilis]|uniref:Uncharacterized protein n=1 Tax=Brachionus plicatilis TaxID=10195 RepID=A0A3M7QZT4_BRAPC|nr:hypothetical protein BpHYR1_038753 [Brachionus plicatilis]
MSSNSHLSFLLAIFSTHSFTTLLVLAIPSKFVSSGIRNFVLAIIDPLCVKRKGKSSQNLIIRIKRKNQFFPKQLLDMSMEK